MKMSKIEKKFVNSKRQGEKNLQIIKELFEKFDDLSKAKKVLEIGCGVGVIASYLSSEQKMNVIGSDLDLQQIKLAREHQVENKNLKFVEADATKLPFKDKEFQMIISMNVFHHIPNWEKALDEINRVLKPKGYFLFYDLTYANIIKNLFKPLAKNYVLYTITDIIDFLLEENHQVIYQDKKRGILKNHCLVFQKNQ